MKKSMYVLLLTAALVMSSSCTVKNEISTGKYENSEPNNPYEFHIEGELPDIGDFSGAVSSSESDAPYEFVPDDDYGKIIPYIGSFKLYQTPKTDGEDWYAESGYSSYGFVDENGKVIMRASDKNTYVNYTRTDDGFGFYTVSREVRQRDDAPDEYIPAETLIIPEDGSWCLKLDGDRMWHSLSGGGYISVVEYPEDESGGRVQTRLYDYNGKLVKTLDGMDSVGIYSNGLLMVGEWKDNSYSAHFINDDGEMVLGPYRSTTSFNNFGITYVQDENGAYLMNTGGERLTDYYENIINEYFDDGSKCLFVARHFGNNKKLDVFSDKGEFIGIIEGTSYASIKAPKNGGYLYYYTDYDYNDKGYPIYNSERLVYRRISDGSEFLSKEFGVSPNAYGCTDNCYIHLDKENGVCYLFDGIGETIGVIEDDVTEVNCVSENGEYVVYTTGVYDYKFDDVLGNISIDTRKTYIYDTKNKQVIFSFDKGMGAYISGENQRYIALNWFDDKGFFGGVGKTWLFDTKTGKMLFEEYDVVSIYETGNKTYISTYKDNCSVLYDDELKVLRKSYYE